jgi:hypothetical protein
MNKNQASLAVRLAGRSLFAIAIALLFTSTIVFASTPQGTFEKTLQVNGPVDLEVLTHSGDVTVRAGSSGSVVIRGKIYVGDRWFGGRREDDVRSIEQNPPIRQEGNSIHIDYVNVRNISVDYEISVPAQTAVRTRSGSGDQTIEGTQGNVDVQTGSGDVKLGSSYRLGQRTREAAFECGVRRRHFHQFGLRRRGLSHRNDRTGTGAGIP